MFPKIDNKSSFNYRTRLSRSIGITIISIQRHIKKNESPLRGKSTDFV